MKRLLSSPFRAMALVCGMTLASSAQAQVFDVNARAAVVQGSALAESCRAIAIDPDWDLSPISALSSTDGYGSDQATQEFAWAMMVYGGHALAGDSRARATLRDTLLAWAAASALYQTEFAHDAYFALKRSLLPMIVSYAIIRDDLSDEERNYVDDWMDGLVRLADQKFDGDVDFNNHRYLADSVIAAWGALVADGIRIGIAEDRLRVALLEQLRDDGSWPLETRRGARALWYQRQSIASLTSIVGALAVAGRDPLDDPEMAAAFDLSVRYLLDGIRTPALVLRYAAENYIPGPSDNYAEQDLSFLNQRPHGRHYLGFLELTGQLVSDPVLAARVQALIDSIPADQFPLIDEFSGGNATCFWEPFRG